MSLDWKSSSQWWYGRFTINGRSKQINLGVKIKGHRPDNLHGRGDEVFRLSRERALIKHDACLAEIEDKRNLQHLTERMIELKTDAPVESVPLKNIVSEWSKIPRSKTPSQKYSAVVKSRLKRFVGFIGSRFPAVDDLDMVARKHVQAFMDEEEARGIGPKTWNDTLKTLRTTFRHFAPESDAFRKFLSTCPAKASETVFRNPFTPDDLKAILEAARDDHFIRPLIVTAMCTAMRRGDCCLLKWRDVDLKQRFITVKTTKTSQTVIIPIFPLLFEELSQLQRTENKYVFPEAATMYRRNPDGITQRLRCILFQAGFVDSQSMDRIKAMKPLPVVSNQELRERLQKELNNASFSIKKKKRMSRVFDLYQKGNTIPEIEAISGFSRGSVSGYLNEFEQMTGFAVVRRPGLSNLPPVVRGEIRTVRKNGKRRASVRDFHSFRVTWVTLALTAGVPLELVQRVTGHKTVDVVLKHYFHPGREDFRKALESAMPQLLMNGRKSRDDQLLEILECMSPSKLRKQALALLEQ
jgi:integrase